MPLCSFFLTPPATWLVTLLSHVLAQRQRMRNWPNQKKFRSGEVRRHLPCSTTRSLTSLFPNKGETDFPLWTTTKRDHQTPLDDDTGDKRFIFLRPEIFQISWSCFADFPVAILNRSVIKHGQFSCKTDIQARKHAPIGTGKTDHVHGSQGNHRPFISCPSSRLLLQTVGYILRGKRWFYRILFAP